MPQALKDTYAKTGRGVSYFQRPSLLYIVTGAPVAGFVVEFAVVGAASEAGLCAAW